MVIFLSKPNKPPVCTPSSPRQVKTKTTRVWIPPREDMPHPSSLTTNQKVPKEENQGSSQSHLAHLSCDSQSDKSHSQDLKTAGPRPGMPSVRPNAMKNRQRQLEAFLKYEKKMRQSGAHISQNDPQPGTSSANDSWSSRNGINKYGAHIMYIHVLDISDVVRTKTVTWQPLCYSDSGEMPEETIFYTLVEGRGELVLFGGINKDIQSIQREFGIKSHLVTNRLYFLKPEMPRLWVSKVVSYEPRHDKTWLREFLTRPDTNRLAQPQKLARVLKFQLYILEILYYLSSEQQRHWSDCVDAQADLRLCCSHMT